MHLQNEDHVLAGTPATEGSVPITADHRHQTMAFQELAEVDETLAKYLGPTHLIRKDLARLLNDLRDKLDGISYNKHGRGRL